MAILKHFSMKSGNYSGAINYLTYKHDEFTQKVVNDDYGHPVLRDGIIFDGINCDPYAYDYDCVRTNLQFHKNQGFDDVKQHHYIISFDPKDVTECGLTAEKAQEIGMDYARRNFPGHQTLVCTHLDGHKHSGNIHCHIVFNSLRKLDVDRRTFMERQCDNKAGYKYHETKKMMVYLKKDLMETCKKHNLHQVDLLSPAKNRVTNREYYAKERLEMKEAEKTVSGKIVPYTPAAETSKTGNATGDITIEKNTESPARTKAETHKDYLRAAIIDAAKTATSDKDFSAVLMDKYNVTLKISRGRFSYLHPERTKPIRGRMLGTDYEEAALREQFRKNEHNLQTDQPAKSKTVPHRHLPTVNGHSEQEKISVPAISNAAPETANTDNTTATTDVISAPSTGTPVIENSTVHEAEPDNTEVASTDSPEPANEPEPPHLAGQWKDEYGFIHHAKIPMPKELATPSEDPFIRSMQNAVIDSINTVYVYRSEDALLNDLRELSRSVCYAQENNLTSIDIIEAAYSERLASLRDSYSKLSSAEERIDLINEKIHFVGVYRSTSAVYKQYRALTPKDREAFLDKHYEAINAHNQAYRFLTSNGHPKKLPSIQALTAYKNEQVFPARDMIKKDYATAKAEVRKLTKLRENIYPLLYNTHSRSIERDISRCDAR